MNILIEWEKNIRYEVVINRIINEKLNDRVRFTIIRNGFDSLDWAYIRLHHDLILMHLSGCACLEKKR